MSTYKTDFYGWAFETAEKLRQGKFSEIDMEEVAEELEGMAKSERRELRSRLTVLLVHLLKWRYQPERRGNSWRLTIKEQRIKATQVIEENPSLQPELTETMTKAYLAAVPQVARETNLAEEIFPATFEHTGWTLAQVLDETFYPES